MRTHCGSPYHRQLRALHYTAFANLSRQTVAEPKDPLEEDDNNSKEIADTENGSKEVMEQDESKFVARFTPKLKKRQLQNVRNNIPTQRAPMYKPVCTGVCVVLGFVMLAEQE